MLSNIFYYFDYSTVYCFTVLVYKSKKKMETEFWRGKRIGSKSLSLSFFKGETWLLAFRFKYLIYKTKTPQRTEAYNDREEPFDRLRVSGGTPLILMLSLKGRGKGEREWIPACAGMTKSKSPLYSLLRQAQDRLFFKGGKEKRSMTSRLNGGVIESKIAIAAT
jgi:hypothetical protein